MNDVDRQATASARSGEVATHAARARGRAGKVATRLRSHELVLQRVATGRRAFTLVELLVVIVIIAILVALLVPTIGSALRTAKNGQIGVEIGNLATAMKSYRAENLAYPPDFAGDDAHDRQVALKNHLARNHRNRKPNDVPDRGGLDPSEALVFWLSGLSPSPTHPVTGPGDRTPLYEFDQSRLRDADGDGWLEYYPKDSEQPYVYLQSENYGMVTKTVTGGRRGVAISTGAVVQPYKSESGFADPEGFQIICAGLDNEFGAQGGVYPTALAYTPADQDNITNFSEGQTLEDAIP